MDRDFAIASKIILAVFLSYVLVFLTGCATPAKPQAMVVQPRVDAPVLSDSLKSSFFVSNVSGGKGTNPLWTSKVGNAEFKEALEKSLAIAGLLASSDSAAKYKVSAILKELKQPFIGATFKVDSDVEYQISGENGIQTIPIKAQGVATMGDSWVGVSRLRIANEKSINENIKAFLKRLENFE